MKKSLAFLVRLFIGTGASSSFAAFMFAASLYAAEVPGTPRDSNFNNTGGYDSTRVEAQLVVPVKQGTKVLHFIRDNNDPRVVTKTYVLDHVDPYEFRDQLRKIVQSKRVGNTSLQQQYPANTKNPLASTVDVPVVTAPASAQPTYDPALQLGSNTAVECLKFSDGTGLLFVSAEEYRFYDHDGGMGIDTIVETLDNPAMGTISYGSQMFFYMPKFVPARNLMPLIENMGMNVSDVTENWQGQDIVAYDPELNWLIFDTATFSCDNIAQMIKQYDVPIPQVRLKITVYEVYSEDDEKMGLDFQSWKNNEGTDFFSGGGRFRNNWSAMYNGNVLAKPFGSERSSFYNFNPKWNTRYIDFLVSLGKARIAHTGEMLVRNNTSAVFDRTTQIFYVDDSKSVDDALTLPDTGVGPYELLSSLIGQVITKKHSTVPGDDIPVAKGEKQVVTGIGGFGFTMKINNASVNMKETRFNITLNNSSLIGFASNGAPRIAKGNTVNQDVSLPHGNRMFVIGGLRKQELVKSKTGIPYLMQIPILGYLFCSESDSVKHSELVVTAECEWDAPRPNLNSGVIRRGTRIQPGFVPPEVTQ